VAQRLINAPKIMITIFWNSFRIHVLAALLEKTSFDAECFLDYVLASTEELRMMHAAEIQKQALIIYVDNSLVHKSKAAIQRIASWRVKISPHPPHSLDLAP
jgi:hypothetical protein